MEWKEVTLGEIAIFKTGKLNSNAATSNGEYPFFTCSPETLRINNYAFDQEAILLAGNNADGNFSIKYYKGKFNAYQRTYVITPIRGKVDIKFLYYALSLCLKQFKSMSRGTSTKFLTVTILNSFSVQLPSISDQRRIATILSSLDRKIELNNQINADLEEMAQAIFKNWFVDFEPFKDGKFVESELGMIPEGWKVSQIIDIPHILETGRRPKGGAVEEGIPSVGAEHVKGMCSYDYSKTKYINAEFASKLKSGKIKGYELLIYKDGGKPGYFIPNFSIFGEGYPFEECYLNEHVFKLDFNDNKGFNIFCYFFFKTKAIMKYLNAQGAKAAIPGINKKDIEYIYILSPNNDAVRDFGIFALPLFKKILQNANENLRLSHLRDTLLPKLMSGELEVSE